MSLGASAFEHLGYTYNFQIIGFPKEWMPLFNLYDPDFPLFPFFYFHILTENPEEASNTDRIFGFIDSINTISNGIEIKLITNKDLSSSEINSYIPQVENEIKERLGYNNPVTYADINNAFTGILNNRNILLSALWQRIVTTNFNNMLPFGKFYDKIFGFIRFISSFYSQSGRRGELIQTHYFLKKFGVKINVDPNISKNYFYLLPTNDEFTSNNLINFSKFSSLVNACDDFTTRYCNVQNIGQNMTALKFNNPSRGNPNKELILYLIGRLNPSSYQPLIDTFNAFNKGPMRTIIFIQMLSDLISGRLDPSSLTAGRFLHLSQNLKRFFQSPKVIALYAQQCFGNTSTVPVDLWVDTFLKWPFSLRGAGIRHNYQILNFSNNLGKVERLIWMASQIRKVHSPLFDDALWCVKKSSGRNSRGSNPLACGACVSSIRQVCSAYQQIQNTEIVFNQNRTQRDQFEVWTSSENNIQSNQTFKESNGRTLYGDVQDDFSSVDFPEAFNRYPQPGHDGSPLSVTQFIRFYSLV